MAAATPNATLVSGRPRNGQEYCMCLSVALIMSLDPVTRPCHLIMLQDQVTWSIPLIGVTKRSAPRTNKINFSICQFNWQVHASIYIYLLISCLRQMFRSGPLKGGLQEKMYFLLGCVRCASGKYDLIDRECDFQRKLFKNQFLHDIFMENSKRYEKWGQDTAKVRKWIPGWAKVKERAPKVSQGTPKVSQKGAKGSQKWASGSQKWANGSQKGAQSEPNST